MNNRVLFDRIKDIDLRLTKLEVAKKYGCSLSDPDMLLCFWNEDKSSLKRATNDELLDAYRRARKAASWPGSSYPIDFKYLDSLREEMRKRGLPIPLFGNGGTTITISANTSVLDNIERHLDEFEPFFKRLNISKERYSIVFELSTCFVDPLDHLSKSLIRKKRL